MKYPSFYQNVKKIKMFDPLADVLGSAENGIIEYSFIDAVKYTGHGCPTVAGAYMVCVHALENLYTDGEIPTRGGIKVSLRALENEGANGVIGNVFTFLLGAGGEGGFKGLGGNFSRHNLIEYGVKIRSQFAFCRTDNNKKVYIDYHPEHVPSDPRVSALLKKILIDEALSTEKKLFHDLWNQRVEKLLIDHQTNTQIYSVTFE